MLNRTTINYLRSLLKLFVRVYPLNSQTLILGMLMVEKFPLEAGFKVPIQDLYVKLYYQTRIKLYPGTKSRFHNVMILRRFY